MSLLLGIDVSTTASKALLIDEDGGVVTSASTPHDISSPHPLWSEQDPEQWWSATQISIRKVLQSVGVKAEDIAAIGLTGQMHGLVMLDSDGKILRPAMLWNDQRASVECDAIREKMGLARLVELTGNDAFTGFTAPKLLWVRKHERDVYAQTKQILLPKDYIRYRLSGSYATDKAGAGGTLLLDLERRDWSDEILNALDIPADWLPPTYEGVNVTGSVSGVAAKTTGLIPGTPVVGGGGDQSAQALGMGAINPDVWGLTLGTSGVVFAPCDLPTTESQGRVHAFPHALPDRWHVMGVMLSAAGSLAWYHDAMVQDLPYEDMLNESEDAPPGCDGLFFQPYLSGERTPHADPHVRGSFLGLTTRHGRAHLTRAVLEGVAFGLRDNFSLLKKMGLPVPKQVRLSGGGSKSPVWRQIICDVLGVDLVTVQTTEGAAFGAALLAGVGARVWSDVDEACQSAIRLDAEMKPNPATADTYDELYAQHQKLYPALKSLYSE